MFSKKNKIALLLSLAIVTAPVLGFAAASVTGPQPVIKREKPPKQIIVRPPRVVPEIDASSGTQALVLMVGAMLLVGERFRRRISVRR